MSFFVYILFSLKDKKLYVGHTDNLEKRLKDHNGGKVKSTERRKPLILLYDEKFSTRSLAARREKFLKSLYGARFKQKLVKDYLKNKKEILK